ncbi:hypothetical protein KC887_01260 [Candidatus Kaiserbacteria bacterium]|nr:hypothetical protein [Candidatus Kaiserbacteria bacterium]
MCQECANHYEMVPVTKEIKETAALVSCIYVEHGVGGNLHVLLDDWNIDGNVDKEWHSQNIQINYADMSPEGQAAERAVLAAFVDMTENERAMVLRIASGMAVIDTLSEKH